ncbi:MAG: HAMP domain-containing histidine kinase [Saprospirales bacterium]|nr:HAMP domain-containing histidine kinase [Saprospirales bacterium]
MNRYTNKSRWKWYLAAGGLLIVAVSLVYTNYVTSRLAREEYNKVGHWLMAQEAIAKPLPPECDPCLDFTLHTEILKANTTIPVILVSETGVIIDAFNFGEGRDTNRVFLEQELARMEAEGVEPIEGFAQRLYFKKSNLLTLLEYFPLVQLGLIGVFIGFGYIGFSTARRSEQNRVWVGMAKETAHQLGTPTSAIIGWIEHLRSIRGDDAEVQQVVDELFNDVGRLELIADRFSKIGSSPELQPIDIFTELEKSREYMQARAPRKVAFDFPGTAQPPLLVHINSHLFAWVVENLLRNALDAMEGTGKLTAAVHHDSDYIYIDISDTGKGIPASKWRTVFLPGYTTKKRGWGLGLSLAKRIIEDYHSGKIYVKKSVENEGTTFTIQLPKKKTASRKSS